MPPANTTRPNQDGRSGAAASLARRSQAKYAAIGMISQPWE